MSEYKITKNKHGQVVLDTDLDLGMALLHTMDDDTQTEVLLTTALQNFPLSASKHLVAWASAFYQRTGKTPAPQFYDRVDYLTGNMDQAEMEENLRGYSNVDPGTRKAPVAPQSIEKYKAAVDTAAQIKLHSGQHARPCDLLAELPFDLDERTLMRWKKMPKWRKDVAAAVAWMRAQSG